MTSDQNDLRQLSQVVIPNRQTDSRFEFFKDWPESFTKSLVEFFSAAQRPCDSLLLQDMKEKAVSCFFPVFKTVSDKIRPGEESVEQMGSDECMEKREVIAFPHEIHGQLPADDIRSIAAQP